MKAIIKRITAFSIFTLIFFYCNAQSPVTRTAYEYIYQQDGSIKSSQKFAPIKTSYEKYDNHGNIIEEGSYSEWDQHIHANQQNNYITLAGRETNFAQDHLNTLKLYHYDDQQKLTADELWSVNNNKKIALIYKTNYTYHPTGMLQRATRIGKDGKMINSTTRLFLRGKVVTIDTVFTIHSFGKETEETRDTIIFDGLGRIAEQIHYINGKFIYRNQYSYGSRTLKESSFHQKKDSLSVITQFYYDAHKRLLSEQQQVKNGNTKIKKVYLYDRKGRLAKTLHYASGRLTGYVKYAYSNDTIKANNLTQAASFSKKDFSSSYPPNNTYTN